MLRVRSWDSPSMLPVAAIGCCRHPLARRHAPACSSGRAALRRSWPASSWPRLAASSSSPATQPGPGGRGAPGRAASRAPPSARWCVFRSISRHRAARAGRSRSCPSARRGRRRSPALHCDRVYLAGGRGLCLRAGRGLQPAYRVEIFGARPDVCSATPSLTGIPSRARVSPDGRARRR